MEKERKTKKRKRIILQIVMWTCILISVGTCTRYILWVLPRRPKPNNQPKYSSKEESYFKELEKRNNWKNPDRYIYNINGKGEPLPNDSVFLTRTTHIHSVLILRILQLFFHYQQTQKILLPYTYIIMWLTEHLNYEE